MTLLILLAPLLVFAALAIKISSRGSVFYSQRRVGSHGRVFHIYKLRTMIPEAEAAGPKWATSNDSRVTPIGRLLRLTRLDELPQLWNVIKGDMSLVGPRPERPEFMDELAAHVPYFRARLCVRPGLTGWAQIKYRYGNTLNDAETKLEYDLFYIKNRSLWFDVLILCKTIKTVLSMKGT